MFVHIWNTVFLSGIHADYMGHSALSKESQHLHVKMCTKNWDTSCGELLSICNRPTLYQRRRVLLFFPMPRWRVTVTLISLSHAHSSLDTVCLVFKPNHTSIPFRHVMFLWNTLLKEYCPLYTVSSLKQSISLTKI